MARLGRFEIFTLFETRIGGLEYVRYPDIWGVGFETRYGHIFAYSRPDGGLFYQDWDGDIHQITGTCQFWGKYPVDVMRYLQSGGAANPKRSC